MTETGLARLGEMGWVGGGGRECIERSITGRNNCLARQAVAPIAAARNGYVW